MISTYLFYSTKSGQRLALQKEVVTDSEVELAGNTSIYNFESGFSLPAIDILVFEIPVVTKSWLEIIKIIQSYSNHSKVLLLCNYMPRERALESRNIVNGVSTKTSDLLNHIKQINSNFFLWPVITYKGIGKPIHQKYRSNNDIKLLVKIKNSFKENFDKTQSMTKEIRSQNNRKPSFDSHEKFLHYKEKYGDSWYTQNTGCDPGDLLAKRANQKILKEERDGVSD